MKGLQICYSIYPEFWIWRPLSDPSKGLTRVSTYVPRRVETDDDDEILGVSGERGRRQMRHVPKLPLRHFPTTLSTVRCEICG